VNDSHYVNPNEFHIPTDDELRHWLAHNYKTLNDPRYQDAQAQMLTKMQIVIVEELLHHRSRVPRRSARQRPRHGCSRTAESQVDAGREAAVAGTQQEDQTR